MISIAGLTARPSTLTGLFFLLIVAFSLVPFRASGAEGAEGAGAGVGGGVRSDAPREPVRIWADSMEAIRAERLVVFRGDVVAEEDFLVCSDELHITYGEDNAVADITARGNVRLFHGSRAGTSEVAVYDRVGRTLVMTGNPIVEQCSDMVKGAKITVYLDSDRALVESDGTGRVSAVIMPERKCAEGTAVAMPSMSESGEGRCGGRTRRAD
jgi:lipopolysaccharide transport protein LptA